MRASRWRCARPTSSPTGLTPTMFPDATVPPVAGVDGQLSYSAEADGGVGFCHVLLAHQSFLSVTSVVARDRGHRTRPADRARPGTGRGGPHRLAGSWRFRSRNLHAPDH
ncbi:MAG: hypothetical protein ABIQ18_44745 [Umezawaea sp.]